jgi:hypothetical protein
VNVPTWWRSYWPLAVLPLVAVALDLILWARGEAWSLSDWASSFALGAVTTMAVGMLLARRQGAIQEALADLQLTEKIAVLNAATPRLRKAGDPGQARRSLYDCRAGLALLPLARTSMQEEYLRTVSDVLRTLHASLDASLHTRVLWTDDDWADLTRAVEGLRESAAHQARRSGTMAAYWSREVGPHTAALLGAAGGSVPFEVFRRHFTQGADRIRTSLDWDALAALAADGSGAAAAVRLDTVTTSVAAYDPQALSGYHAPWYRDASGTAETSYDAAGAVPLRHAELAADLAVLDAPRRARITALRDHYAARVDGEGISLVLATYALGPGHCLVLDGNHRLTALLHLVDQGCPIHLIEFRLTAPLDPLLLPDLAHHTPPSP